MLHDLSLNEVPMEFPEKETSGSIRVPIKDFADK